MKIDSKEIKVILFDLGNVVIDLDEQASYHAMSHLIGKDLTELKESFEQAEFFDDFERGNISDIEFREQVRTLLNKKNISDQEIDYAWNAMLLGIDLELIKQLSLLKEKVSIMVLSNTNIIHVRCFHQKIYEITGINHLDKIFDKVYFSHEIRERKPDFQAWKIILNENKDIKAEQVLFLDDKDENLEAASRLGINVLKIKKPKYTLELIKKLF